jgi:excisionase family DNA binding protein
VTKKDGESGLLTIPQVMNRLMCGRTKIYDLVHDDRLELVKFGAHSRITERSLHKLQAELLRQRRRRPPSPAA